MKHFANIVFWLGCAVVLVFCLGGVTCQPVHPPIPIEPNDTENCAAACTHLTALGCPEGEPLEDGTSCTKFCVDTQKSGHPLNPTCVMKMTACSELEGCTAPR